MSFTRRQFLMGTGAGLTICTVPGLAKTGPAIADNRLVFVLLRGGMDGLSAVIPYSDPNYRKLRQRLALPEPGGSDGPFKLNGDFALHPAFKNLAALYQDKELIIVPAVASPYRERSHFDGQNVIENGGLTPYELNTGWLNRGLTAMSSHADVHGLAVGQAVPLMMQGPTLVSNWSPSFLKGAAEDTYDRLADMYRHDPTLSSRLASLVKTNEQLDDMESGKPGRRRAGQFIELSRSAAKLLAGDDGAQVATLEVTGWDTHANQGTVTGRLATGFRILDEGLSVLKVGLGPRWAKTTVVVMTEFGRTMKANGTGGTDHGTASTAFLLGGNLVGGKILGDWPGLSNKDLYQGRDLRPMTDSRAVLKTVLMQQLALSWDELNHVFPDSESVQPYAFV